MGRMNGSSTSATPSFRCHSFLIEKKMNTFEFRRKTYYTLFGILPAHVAQAELSRKLRMRFASEAWNSDGNFPGLPVFLYFFLPFAADFFLEVAGDASAIFRQSSRVSDSGTLSFGMR